ncbi:MAG: PKD domain-containing protein [Saprospiraceae bacterium]|nr:PKD domain-containing protein [Saprospiraceae bacterium]
MKNALIKKILLFYFFYFIILTNSMAQYKELLVQRRNQQTNSWCWAACMEMIMNFHTNSNDSLQCELAKRYRKIKTGVNTPSTECCFACNIACRGTNCNGTNNAFHQLQMSVSYGGHHSLVTGDYIDQLFYAYGFNSIQEINRDTQPILWEQIKKQIDDCRPFIITIAPIPGLPDIDYTNVPQNNHALVVKGYHEFLDSININDTLRYIIANDPWRACCAIDSGQTVLPYSVFVDDTIEYDAPYENYFVDRVLSTVHSIFPNAPQHFNCLSCEQLIVTYDGINYVDTIPYVIFQDEKPKNNDTISVFPQNILPPPQDTGIVIAQDSTVIVVVPTINQSPKAFLTVIPDSGQSPLKVLFDASASKDTDGSIITYTYNFGDGNVVITSEPQFEHTYNADVSKTYKVILTVTDNKNSTDTISTSINILPPPSRPSLFSVLTQNAEKVVGFKDNVFNDAKYDSFITQNGYHDADILYLSFNKLNRSPSRSLKKLYSAIIPNQQVKDVVTGNIQPNLISTIQKVNDSLWVLKKITTYTFLSEKATVTVENGSAQNSSFVLSNLRQDYKPSEAINYQLVKYPPFQYEFYSFQVRRRPRYARIDTYISPVEDYPDLELKKGKAYPERMVLKRLTEITRAFAEINKIPVFIANTNPD